MQALRVKVLASKLGDLILVPRTHAGWAEVKGGKGRRQQASDSYFFWPPQCGGGGTHRGWWGREGEREREDKWVNVILKLITQWGEAHEAETGESARGRQISRALNCTEQQCEQEGPPQSNNETAPENSPLVSFKPRHALCHALSPPHTRRVKF